MMYIIEHLESVHFDLLFGGNLLIDQKCQHLCAMISLQLNNFAHLLINNYISITCEFLASA